MKQPQRLNIFDKIVASISPEAGVRRLVARQKLTYFQYEGAQNTRARGNPPILQATESQRNQYDRIKLMRNAQDLEDNVGFVKSILLKMSTYVCGELRYQARTGDPKIDEQYEDYLENWFKICDITGRHTFRELVRLALISTIRDGDMGFIIVRQDGQPLRVQCVEADRIGEALSPQMLPNYFGGITVDQNGRPLSYRVFQRTETGSYINPKEIPADSFVHVFDPKRLDQYRGITAFHAAINTLRDIKEILENEKMGVKWATSQAGVITSATGGDESGYDFDETGTDPNGNAIRTQTTENGALTILSPGEDFKAFSYDRPSPSFQGFLKTLYREVALSLDLPYGFVYDMSELGGPTARLESAQAQRTFRRWETILEDKAIDRLKNLALADGIQRGEIPATKAWMKGKWMFPAHPTIDVGRESKANLDENRQGAKSLADIYSEQGKDSEEELRQIAKEQKLIKDLAVEFGITPQDISLKTPNGNPIESAKPKEKEKEKEDPEPEE